MSIKDGGPAFPQQTDITLAYDGMTLRDYFAGKAMEASLNGCATRGEVILNSDLAGYAYSVADAMLKAREE